MDHYTLSQENNRFIGDIVIHNEEFDETYYGFENHNGRTFLGKGKNHWGKSSKDKETMAKTKPKAWFTAMCSALTSTDRSLRNEHLAERLIRTALANRYGNVEI